MLQKTPKTHVDPVFFKDLVRRIEMLEAERADLADRLREVYSEGGLDERALRFLIKIRKKTPEEERETMDCLAEYRRIVKRD
jgi:uncharacterized protein (UPF0335 family)